MRRCRWGLVGFGLVACCFGQNGYDLLLKGGRVIDPKNGIDRESDVAVRDGRIAAVAPDLDPARAKQTISVRGLHVMPGLIDLHVHVYFNSGLVDAWAGDKSAQPDGFSFRTGVTTMVDAGSAGWRNFEAFRAGVIDRAQTRIFAFVNISGLGMVSNAAEQADFNPEQAARVARKNAGVVVGIKTAHYEKPDWTAIDSALEAGRLAGMPIMVDFGFFLPSRPYWKLVTEKLRPGDISTHMFRGAVPWIDPQGNLYPYLRDARKRGVLFDVGHGGSSFVFRNAVPATAQKFYPDTISTDFHADSMNVGMMDLPTTMSKFLAMGMPYVEVIRASTAAPARVLRHEELGTLSVGGPADIAIMALESGEFGFYDSYGGRLNGTQRLRCEMTLKEGRVVWDRNGRAATPYRQLPAGYGVWPGEAVVPPPASK